MMKYYFKFSFQSNRILNESRKFYNDINVINDEDDDLPPYCFFTSYHLNELDDPVELWARGLSLLSIFKGQLYLNFNPIHEDDDISKIEFSGLFSFTDNLNITPNNSHEVVPSFPFSSKVLINSQFIDTSYMSLSVRNDKVLSLLNQIGNGINWINLYSILDSIKYYTNEDINGFQILLEKSGHTESEVSAFTGTANNFGMIGTAARHGIKGWAKPSKTIDLPKAQKLILDIANYYIKSCE